jgi:hypothetical protein
MYEVAAFRRHAAENARRLGLSHWLDDARRHAEFRDDIYAHDEGPDRTVLADQAARAGSVVAPVPRDIKQVSNPHSR